VNPPLPATTWRHLHRGDLDQPHTGAHTGPTGAHRQRTELTSPTSSSNSTSPPPKKITGLVPADPAHHEDPTETKPVTEPGHTQGADADPNTQPATKPVTETRQRTAPLMPPQPARCAHCGDPSPPPPYLSGTGRPARTCSRACRQATYLPTTRHPGPPRSTRQMPTLQRPDLANHTHRPPRPLVLTGLPTSRLASTRHNLTPPARPSTDIRNRDRDGVAVRRSAQWRTTELPGGGHEICLMVWRAGAVGSWRWVAWRW
jgi:hypothetical protein